MDPNQSGNDHEVKCKNDFVKDSLSKNHNGDIQCAISDSAGLYVTATKDISVPSSDPKTIMSCQAAAVALDPPFRQTHCSFCASSSTTLFALEGCQMVSACTSCGPQLMKDSYHRSKEFAALKKLEATFGPSIDSIFVLTVRLLCCQNKEWWKLFCCLYEHTTDSMQDNIDLICSHLPAPANDNRLFRETLGRVLGCSHNITDFSRPLGNQSLGRAVFLEHSFYNHSCVPNAYLSCNIRTITDDSAACIKKSDPLTAEVHLLASAKEGDEITLSYIPMSGLSNQERQKTLRDGYGFDCNCSACTASIPAISLSEAMDVQSIREIQYSCNERLLIQKKQQSQCRKRRSNQERASENDDRTDEVEQVISLVQMTQRGIRNQGIPETHEVNIESHRLLALAYSILEDWDNAKEHNEVFIGLANKVSDLFDPVALGIQMLEYASVLKQIGGREIATSAQHAQEALDRLQRALGKHHNWVATLVSEEPPPRHTSKRTSGDIMGKTSDKRHKAEGDL